MLPDWPGSPAGPQPNDSALAQGLTALLATGEAHYDQGRYEEAGAVVRKAREALAGVVAGTTRGAWQSRAGAPQPLSALAAAAFSAWTARLQCLVAFRTGEIAQAADAALAFVAAGGADVAGPVNDLQRLDVFCVSVVAAGEVLRFAQSLAHLRLALQAAQRLGTLPAWVRARGTAAAAFALLGDPWAAQRLTAELAGTFQGLSDQPRLEATARSNHCAISLVLTRLAREAGDEVAATEALAHAQASLARMREIVAATGDSRGAAFTDVHEAELALQQGAGARALELLEGAAARARARGLHGHARWLTLAEGEACVSAGRVQASLECLAPLQAELGEAHEFAMRIQLHKVLHRAAVARQDMQAARAHLEQAWQFEQQQRYQQLRAQSEHLRLRLELEHMYRYQAKAGAGAKL
jgi:hypothetical protein